MRSKTFSLLAALTLVLFIGQRAMADEDAPWETAKDEGCAIAVPKAWTNLDHFSPQVLIFRRSDGTGGVPDKDENGGELQAQIIVERVKMEPDLENSANVVAGRVLEQPQTEVIQRAVGDKLKLSDGTDAFLMSMEINRGTQHMLIIKLLCKTDDHNGFVATGTITSSKGSTYPAADGKTAKWLKAMLSSLVKDASKIEAKKVDEAYKARDKK
jgi:hypothetical protein